ncbi:MAG: OmpA family protein [Alphaproteobacteria bacterium]|nr:OmpA family protein [Alphaproteobacteria bacterium]
MNCPHRPHDKQCISIEFIALDKGCPGGTWKVAYADFVTAMMAFFLLMWLLNVTTEEQKNAISNYFDPTHPAVSDSMSGAGGVMGGLTMSPEGSMASDKNPLIKPQVSDSRQRGENVKSHVNKAREASENNRFKKAEEKLKKAIEENARLKSLSENVLIDMTAEGLRIQIVDQENESMFPSGSAEMFEKTRELLAIVTEAIIDMPNEVSIRGHTDATRYGKGAKYTNWELSSDRANASRRVMMENGITKDRLNNVMGKADTEPLIEDNPLDSRNRRLTIILLKEFITNPELANSPLDESGDDEGETAPIISPKDTFRRTPGAVEFP